MPKLSVDAIDLLFSPLPTRSPITFLGRHRWRRYGGARAADRAFSSVPTSLACSSFFARSAIVVDGERAIIVYDIFPGIGIVVDGGKVLFHKPIGNKIISKFQDMRTSVDEMDEASHGVDY